jgi:hypothetical protein
MEQETTKRAAGKAGKKRRRASKALKIDAEVVLQVTAPEGSRFKGYEDCQGLRRLGSEDCIVQDLEFRVHAVGYRRERWITPDAKTLIAALPDGPCRRVRRDNQVETLASIRMRMPLARNVGRA